jgi:uncharacterized protein
MRPTLFRTLAVLIGLICVGLGVVGAFVPLLPSTVFFIGAAACFAYASPRLEAWLLSFDFIGGPVRAWRERGAIPLPAKVIATVGMGLSLIVLAHSEAGALGLGAAAVFLALCAIFIWTRPS